MIDMLTAAAVAAASLGAMQAAPAATVPGVPAAVAVPVPPPALGPNELFVSRDTLLRLMVLNEVSTNAVRPGHRFVLRVDENVVVDGVTIVPVGAKAWGEVLAAKSSDIAGKPGKLSARLLHLELGGHAIPISGEAGSSGEPGGSATALGIMALGPFGLFARGNNAKLKAGEILNGYFVSDLAFDRTAGTLRPIADATSKR